MFNQNLYTVAATIIPVFFIALMFPGGVLTPYWLWSERWKNKHLGEASVGRPLFFLFVGTPMNFLISLPVNLILGIGAAGEVCAVIAIDHRHATYIQHLWVFSSMVMLPIVATLSVMFSFVGALATESNAAIGISNRPSPQKPSSVSDRRRSRVRRTSSRRSLSQAPPRARPRKHLG